MFLFSALNEKKFVFLFFVSIKITSNGFIGKKSLKTFFSNLNYPFLFSVTSKIVCPDNSRYSFIFKVLTNNIEIHIFMWFYVSIKPSGVTS